MDNSLVLNAAIEGASLISSSSLFHSDRQNSVFNESGAAIHNVVVVALKERLNQPGVLAASMDLFCFYRGRLLPETYAFCAL